MKRHVWILLLGVTPGIALSQDLVQVYRDALAYDAQYAAARFAAEAGREKLPQGRALILPTIGLSATNSRSSIDVDSRSPATSPSFSRDTRSYGATLSLSQPLYRPQNLISYDQAELQVRQTDAVLAQAGQDLIVRVSQAYFDLLTSENSLELVKAQKAAISEQLEQAKRNFEVGTATITDTHEAQSRYDLIIAQEITAQNDLENKRRALQQVTGKEYARLAPLRGDVRLSPPNPNVMQTWVDLAEKQSYGVQVQQAVSEIAALEVRRQRAGHLPTVDLVASYAFNSQSGTATSAVGTDGRVGTLGIQAALPLYQGGAIESRIREASANSEKAKQDLENARRSAALAARQSYVSVVNGIAQVRAFEQALVSSQSAVESNRLGYEVGVRINIDVLNAQQQLFSTRRDLALARYNTITNHLRLKAAAGSLKQDDLEEVNRALAP